MSSEFSELLPSISAPLLQSNTDINTDNYYQQQQQQQQQQRPRRHTITDSRPDSAIDLLLSDDDEEEQQQQTFDRISNILSNLIQEANDAVYGIEKERVHLLKTSKPTEYNIISRTTTRKSNRTSIMNRRLNNMNSVTFPISPTMTNSSNIMNATTTTTTTYNNGCTSTQLKKHSSRHQLMNNNTFTSHRPHTLPTIPRKSITPRSKRNSNSSIVTDPVVMESFKRLDTSMAMIDSLSRDLVPQQPTTTTNTKTVIVVDPSLQHHMTTTLLLLVPLLHIPHSLITMIFDFFSSADTITPPFPSSMLFWAFVFAVINLMIDQVAVIPKKYVASKIRRMSLPGTYAEVIKKKRNHGQQQKTIKRSWIPKSIQKQYHFQIEQEEDSPLQRRRNSI